MVTDPTFIDLDLVHRLIDCSFILEEAVNPERAKSIPDFIARPSTRRNGAPPTATLRCATTN
jgi:hypothetical protein